MKNNAPEKKRFGGEDMHSCIANEASLLPYYSRVLIERVLPKSQAEQVREGSLHIFPVLQPFRHPPGIHPFPRAEHTIDDQGYTDHFERNEGNVSEQVRKQVVGILEDH
jgi:hypothetical protein